MKDLIDKAHKLHFVGIGGIGMSSIAQYLSAKGYTITGSDLSKNSSVKKLEDMGIKVNIGHSTSNIDDDVDAVIVSSAIKGDNIEMAYAQKKNTPVIKRYQILSYIVNSKKSIAIAGSHGKTTTTSLCASLLKNAQIDPTAIIGGQLRNINNNVMVGNSDYFIIEADESDGGFLLLNPEIGVVTNIDNDHLGFYGNFENEKMAFRDFIDNSKIKILNLDDPVIKDLKGSYKDAIKYSIMNKKADIYAYNIKNENSKSFFDVKTTKRVLKNLELGIIGIHNISNALSVIAIADIFDIDENIIRETFAEFQGVYRRFTYIGKYNNLNVYDDYAHHPTEIKATIQTARLVSDKIYALFQPHRFSRTAYLIDGFAKSFKDVSKVFVLDIYSATEKPIEGIDSEILVDKINNFSSNAIYIRTVELLEKFLNQIEDEGVLLALGAGSVSSIAKELVNDKKKS
jgi:UDP-N-acetylmuramate--alanine ligase